MSNLEKKIQELVDYYDLKNKNTIVIENGKSFNLGKFSEENNELKEVLKYIDKKTIYLIEGNNEIIINYDYKAINPYVRYLLNNIEESQELQKIKTNLLISIITIVLIIILFICCFFVRNAVKNNNKGIMQIITVLNKIGEKQKKHNPKPIDNFFIESNKKTNDNKPITGGSGIKGEHTY